MQATIHLHKFSSTTSYDHLDPGPNTDPTTAAPSEGSLRSGGRSHRDEGAFACSSHQPLAHHPGGVDDGPGHLASILGNPFGGAQLEAEEEGCGDIMDGIWSGIPLSPNAPRFDFPGIL